MDISTWIERYRRAWETADDAAITKIFTADATYRSIIFNEPHVGSEGIAAYWRRAPGTQREVSVRMGRPVIGGEEVAVEFWTTMVDADNGRITLAGCMILRFEKQSGLCSSLREYWTTSNAGWLEPPPEWGGAASC